MNATATERGELTTAVSDAATALDRTRAERVVVAALDPTNELWNWLGTPPETRGGLAAWCGIVERLESFNDHRPTAAWAGRAADRGHPILGTRSSHSGYEWDELASLLADAPEVIDTAGRLDLTHAGHSLPDQAAWQPAIKAAGRVLAAERPVPAIDQSLGIEL